MLEVEGQYHSNSRKGFIVFICVSVHYCNGDCNIRIFSGWCYSEHKLALMSITTYRQPISVADPVFSSDGGANHKGGGPNLLF